MSLLSEIVATVVQSTSTSVFDNIKANNVSMDVVSLNDLSADDVWCTNIHVSEEVKYDELNVAMNFTAGSQNVLVGQAPVAPNLTTGATNIVMGQGAGSSLNTGDNNVFLGSGAGTNITSAIRNIAIGTNALSGATVFNDNIGIGANTGASVVGGDNVIVGNNAGKNVGDANVIMGYQAVGQVEVVGSNNIVIGTQAGNNVNVGDYNILVGYQAQTGGTLNNTVALGTNCVASQSNTIYIGNQITNPYQHMILGRVYNAGGGINSNTLIPGPFDSDALAQAGGVLSGQLYFKNINVGPKHRSVLCICLA